MAVVMKPVLKTSAETLATNSFQSLDTDEAMGTVRDALLFHTSSKSKDVFAVIVHHREPESNERTYLTVVNEFLQAYWKGWAALSRIAQEQRTPHQSGQFKVLRDPEASEVRVYWGKTDAKDLRKQVEASPGIYVIPSHLDHELLTALRLPPLPEPFRESPVVVQLKSFAPLVGEQEAPEAMWPWKALEETLSKQLVKEGTIGRETHEWQDQFMSQYPSLTSEQVAQIARSSAKNIHALASRWVAEKKIFSVQFGRRTLYPQFQFVDGSPSPVIREIMEQFPRHATGWDYAFFLTTPNTYIGGRRPIELLKTDPERLVSLARSFANPADAF